MRAWLLAALLTLGIAESLPAQSQPLLQLQGEPYFGGTMHLHLTGTVGQPALLAYGLNPLPVEQPFQTGKGPWYIGSFVNLAPLGTIPSGGRLNLIFNMPPLMPALAGIPIAMQGYVPFALSNPVTLPLDIPYYEPSSAALLTAPVPVQAAHFSDRIASGDINGDGAIDLAVGAWREDYAGVDSSGRAYVVWGPDFEVVTPLSPPDPKPLGHFGLGVAVVDLTGDGVSDVLVGETAGDPAPPGELSRLHAFAGGPNFADDVAFEILSAGSGSDYGLFGRALTTGDYNGDGAADVAVGIIFGSSGPYVFDGWVDVYWGPIYGPPSSLFSPDPGSNEFFGTVLTTADVNGDGIDDLLEASSRETANGTWGIGRAHLFVGPDLDHYKSIENPLPAGTNSWFGNSLVATDINGDGIAEVVATDQKDHAYIFWSPDFEEYRVIDRPPPGIVSNENSVSFGYEAAVGDVNGDGDVDVLVSDVFSGTATGCGSFPTGVVFVALGPYHETFHVLMAGTPECAAEFGWTLHLADLDADGDLELLSGSDLGDVGPVQGAGHLSVFTRP